MVKQLIKMKFKVLVALLFLLTIFGCSVEPSWKALPQHAVLTASDQFSLEELDAISLGGDMWARKSQDHVSITIVVVSGPANIERQDPGGSKNGKAWYVDGDYHIQLQPGLVGTYGASVFAHEIGHLFGLEHSDTKSSLMYERTPQLTDIDDETITRFWNMQ